jgi:hypothetical protein
MPSDPKQFFETLRRFRDKLVPKQEAPKQVLPPVPEKQVERKELPPFPAGNWIPTTDPSTRFQVIKVIHTR